LQTWGDRHFTTSDLLWESKLPWLLSQYLPPKTIVFVANSTPVRDVEWFWRPNDLEVQLFCNRGANGIDGTLSTALGLLHQGPPGVLLTGDLAFLHDTNGCLAAATFTGQLTIILINNQGGGIFEMLPIAEFEPPFETYFATPQTVAIATLCQAYRIPHTVIHNQPAFCQAIQTQHPGIRVLEIKTDRKADQRWRQQTFESLKHFPGPI
jgi:2-succinyl-5-enolpyruvyl-6-hydroxy-3-cyclohexene-1-carboxylate synthase